MTAMQTMRAENRVVIAHLYTSTAAICLGAIFGVFQGFSRAGVVSAPAWFDYYRILTLHGVLMALVFTTFFITGLSLFVTYRSIPRDRKTTAGWLGWTVMLVGTAMAAVTILMGDATVLYTFYAPLKASPFFYLGATILVAGTWIVAYEVLENVAYFRKQHPGEPLPLPVFLAASTFLMWIIATIGVVAEMCLLIPWSMGWTPGIDVMMTRLFFWYFGHPLVYFWIMGAYIVWYTIVPTRYGGKVFSDALTRLTFIMLLLLSTPVGIHHEFMEPGISTKWKMLHTVLTYGVAVPSFLTAFAVFASFEMAARRAGRTGFIDTVKSLPWGDPVFSGAGYGMLLFILGGFGGLINASYSMDMLVHNTVWIVGHFHVTVGGPAALTFLGCAYWMISAADRTRALETGLGAMADATLVRRHAHHVALAALRGAARRAAPDGERLLRRHADPELGARDDALGGGRLHPLHQHHALRRGCGRHAVRQPEDRRHDRGIRGARARKRSDARDASASLALGSGRAAVRLARLRRPHARDAYASRVSRAGYANVVAPHYAPR